jgi:hypothetical protein
MFTLKLILSSSKLPIDVTVISANNVVPSSSCSLGSFKNYVLNLGGGGGGIGQMTQNVTLGEGEV